MPVLRSRLDLAAAETRVNHDAMAGLVDELRQRQHELAHRGAGGDDRSIERHKERGKFPVRERIDRLLDPGSPFLELSPLAATGLYDDDAPGAGIGTGIGRVEGTTCVIVANDATVKGGRSGVADPEALDDGHALALGRRVPFFEYLGPHDPS